MAPKIGKTAEPTKAAKAAHMEKAAHTTNYADAFIEIADDCSVEAAEIPPSKNGQPTVASLQYDLIAGHPYKYTSDDVIFKVYAQKSGVEETIEARAGFFAKGQPCLRASPLSKRYGWGVHSDAQGRVAIYAIESAQYKRFALDSQLKHLKAMRSSRA